jgi:D-3-phosphoglycerate dehydrogenase / 2-oxoglutarate reductase
MNRKPSVFITHDPQALENYYGPRALAALESIAHVKRRHDSAPWTPESLAAAAARGEIIVSDRSAEGTAALFESLPQLRAFCRCAIDIRNVDLSAASAHGILVTQASAGFVNSVSEWVLGVMIDLSRGISRSVHLYRAGLEPGVSMGRELRGATIGVVGYGQIGRHLAQSAVALGMRVLAYDPYVRLDEPAVQQVDMGTLLAQADHVVSLAPALPETENLFAAEAFTAMKPGAFFINASRGNLVDEEALVRALNNGHLAGCALDVGRAHDQMPCPALARHPLVVATPHIGGLTPQAVEHQSMETVSQIASLLQGQVPLGAVNAPHASRLHLWKQGPTT